MLANESYFMYVCALSVNEMKSRRDRRRGRGEEDFSCK